jgi:quinone-modifying oxidoreductase subunit QmoA
MTTGSGGSQTILVVGGGISGMTAAVEAAEVGYSVILVEKNPYLGGRVAQHNKYFPKLCTPSCGLEINYQRIRNNARVTFYTLTEVEAIEGTAGNFTVRLRQHPRFVSDKCTACGECARACTTEVEDPFNFDMGKAKAIRLAHEMAFPQRYVMDAGFAGTDEAKKLAQLCPVGAIEPDMAAKEVTVNVGSIVWATGWRPYDPARIQPYGFGRFENVLNNMRFERLASRRGPTGGQLVRPSDGKQVRNIAFIQCAGSRDHNYLPFCSQVCCLASMKQATYVREQYPDATVTIYYIDLRAMDRYEGFLQKVQGDSQIRWVKSKPARVDEDPATRDPVVVGEDTLTGIRYAERYDLVVLASGMEPNTAIQPVPAGQVVQHDAYGFVINEQNGIHAVGCAASPVDVASAVQSATAAALKAIQTIRKAAG